MDSMQALQLEPMVDRIFSQPEFSQLSSPYHSMLPPSQGRDPGVNSKALFARPSQPVDFAG